jgi:GntR family transcriptional regulator
LRRWCTSCTNTVVIPFRVHLQPGLPIYEQTVYAATRAILIGALPAGAPFPSVRTLSRELKINPNTAHKVIAALIADGLLQAQPGIGTVVAPMPSRTGQERAAFLTDRVEALVVEARRIGVELPALQQAISDHWERLRYEPDEAKRDNTAREEEAE